MTDKLVEETLARRPLDYFEEVVSGAALVVVIAATCWGVVTRYITAQPAAWTGEVAAIAFAWLVFVGAAAGLKYGTHVTIDMLVVRLPRAIGRPLIAAADLLVLLFLLTVFVLAVEFAINAWDDPTPVLRLPRSLTYTSVVVGSLCMFIRYTRTAWRRWQGMPAAWLSASGTGAEL